MTLILVIGAAVEHVRRMVINEAGEWISDIAARLLVDFMPGILRDVHCSIQFQPSRAQSVGRLEQRQIRLAIVLEVPIEDVVLVVVGAEPDAIAHADHGIGFEEGGRGLDRQRLHRVQALRFHDRLTPIAGSGGKIAVRKGGDAGHEILLALDIEQGKSFEPTYFPARIVRRRKRRRPCPCPAATGQKRQTGRERRCRG